MKTIPAKVKRFRRRVAEEPCRACKMEDDTRVSHHFTFTKAGMARKAEEWESCCLCYRCHSELHNHGERSFWRERNINLELLELESKEFYNLYWWES